MTTSRSISTHSKVEPPQRFREPPAHVLRRHRKRPEEILPAESAAAPAHVGRPPAGSRHIAFQRVSRRCDHRNQHVSAGRSCGTLGPGSSFRILVSRSSAPHPASICRRLIIRITVQPPLPHFRRRNHGMSARTGMPAGVSIRRAVAAQCRAATLTRPKMHPPVARLDAFLAYTACGLLDLFDRGEMTADLPDHGEPLGVDYSASTRCTNDIAIDPSPTADETRLILPERTSPAAKMPGMLVSSR